MAELKAHHFFLLFAALLHLATYVPLKCTAVAASPVPSRTQAEALIQWKNSLTSFSSSLDSWSLHNLSNLCNWMGILCASSGTLSGINLYLSNLAGTLAEFKFTSFPNLNQLDFSSNNLSGSIPSEIGNLKDLLSLDFSDNKLSSQIPMTIGDLTKLNTLYLWGNNLSGSIPSEIGNLKDLLDLELSQNKLSSQIPTTIGDLTKLNTLYLWGNNLSGSIPSEIGNLKDLLYLSLGQNKLSGQIPSTIGNLTKLNYLYLGPNNLSSSIPSEIGNLKYLLSLVLAANELFGSVPITIGNLSSLQFLLLEGNLLQGQLPVLPEAKKMIAYSVRKNKFNGQVPSSICNLSGLEQLDLSNNSLKGALPQCLGNFSKNLVVLDLGLNNFHGNIPSGFMEDNKLTSLNLNRNKLNGPFPYTLINCRALEVLNLGNNMIMDIFPHWLATLQQLQVLVLKNNKFHGRIGKSDIKLPFPKLQIFDLSGNLFTGVLPSTYFESFEAMMKNTRNSTRPEYISQNSTVYDDYEPHIHQDTLELVLKGLEENLETIIIDFTTLDLSNNKFEGEIPETIGLLAYLHFLNLSHNSLTGHIPNSLGSLTQLESLDLSVNKVEGGIPWQLTRLTFLAFLNVSQNKLDGAIPEGGQFNTFNNNSYQGNSRLCGFPLTKKCADDEGPSNPRSLNPEKQSLFFDGFTWQSVLMGYGCGAWIGLGIGYLILLTGKPKWALAIVERAESRRWRRSRKSAHTRGQRHRK